MENNNFDGAVRKLRLLPYQEEQLRVRVEDYKSGHGMSPAHNLTFKIIMQIAEEYGIDNRDSQPHHQGNSFNPRPPKFEQPNIKSSPYKSVKKKNGWYPNY